AKLTCGSCPRIAHSAARRKHWSRLTPPRPTGRPFAATRAVNFATRSVVGLMSFARLRTLFRRACAVDDHAVLIYAAQQLAQQQAHDLVIATIRPASSRARTSGESTCVLI